MAFLKRERVNLGRRRLRNILETYTIATGRTLENKIADAGPFNQRIDPHILTIALREMIAAGEIQIHSEGEGKVRWYYLSGVPEDKKIARFGELDAVYQRTQQKDFTLRLGQALEIAVSRALQGQVVFDSMGHYKDLEEHDDSTLYSKEEPPSLISGRAISGKRKLDFVLIGAGAVRAGIEVKNIREWIYVDREEGS